MSSITILGLYVITYNWSCLINSLRLPMVSMNPSHFVLELQYTQTIHMAKCTAEQHPSSLSIEIAKLKLLAIANLLVVLYVMLQTIVDR